MKEAETKAQEFLNEAFDRFGLNLHAAAAATETGVTLDIVGRDAELCLAEGGEVLDALQLLVSQIYGRELPEGSRFICDAEDFRATREAELRAMARHAADRVRQTRTPFTFGPMNSNERRVIHTTLADENDLVTESVGDGPARRLRVVLGPEQ